MAEGAGRYDPETTQVRESTGAKGVMLIVYGGDKGHGFSVQGSDIKFLMGLPEVLRACADEIEKDMEYMNEKAD